jgi:hypothetical protein
MKRSIVVSFCFFLSLHHLMAQKPITMYKTFGNVRFEMDTLNLTMRQVSEILSVNSEALSEFKIARTNYNVAGIFGFTGSLLIAVPVVTAIAGGEPEWGLAAGGAALVLGSIPFSKAFKNRANSALDHYNSQLANSRRERPQLFFTGTSAVLRIKF